MINADVNGARNILRKFKKGWFDLITGLGKSVRVRIYKLSKGISESLLTYQTLSEAPSIRAE